MSFQNTVKIKEFATAFNVLFKRYLNKLDTLAFAPEFQVAGKTIDLSIKRKETLLKKAQELLSDFETIHKNEVINFLTLVVKYNELQPVAKKEIVRKEIQQYKSQLRRLLQILNVKASVILEELDEYHLTFSARIKLERLKDLTVAEVENFWLDSDNKDSPLN